MCLLFFKKKKFRNELFPYRQFQNNILYSVTPPHTYHQERGTFLSMFSFYKGQGRLVYFKGIKYKRTFGTLIAGGLLFYFVFSVMQNASV